MAEAKTRGVSMSEEVVETTEQPATDEGQEPEFTADEIAKYKDLRKEAATRRKENQALTDELAALKAEAEQATREELAEQGKFKTLADQAQARVTELEAVEAQNKTLNGVIDTLLETQKAGLPESLTTLLDKLPAVEQLEWLANNKQEEQQPDAEPDEQEPAKLTPFNPNSGAVKENDAQRIARLHNLTTGKTPFG